MPTFPTDPALEAAIVAHADEDTPRLAYADWLDEHGDPDRAAFIRVQCALADLSPGAPDWVDLTERQAELVARLQHRHAALTPAAPDGFYFGSEFLDDAEEQFRRGFPYFVDCQRNDSDWNSQEVARAAGELAQLVRTGTTRGFHASVPLGSLSGWLAAPAVADLTGLALMYHPTGGDRRAESAEYFRLVATSPALRRIRHLFLYSPYHPIRADELANARTFDSVRRLTVHPLTGPTPVLEKLTRAKWFLRLWHVRCFLNKPSVAVPLVAGLGKLPELHTLELPDFAPGAVRTLTAGRFPALARLVYNGRLALPHAKLLAAAEFPALAAFEARHELRNDGLLALLGAEWFGRLRVLDLSDNAIGDKGVKALVAHPVAARLRVLKLGDNPFGKTGLVALAAPGALPALTTLSLGTASRRKGTPVELAAFLSALRIPHLRHLDLSGWPLGNDGAKALAANPALARLTRLSLDGCRIGDPGAKALFASPHLRNLVELQLGYNAIRTGASALADALVMPRLGECLLGNNKIPNAAAAKLRRDGLYLIA